ncbi:5-formyltetrahydrofolate cyclo-ligase [Acrasis kona]|uniref:5-formyltetrahydrofolate cyclo-ligase n=1 Tax=Acrasis kona TaxID=1008807 RepID=A0AAW2Z7N8_9EUKA
MMLAKAELRKNLKSALSKLSTEIKHAESKSVISQVLSSQVYNQSSTICCYVPMLEEIDTIPLIRHSLKNNKHVYVPNIRQDGLIEMLKIEDENDFKTFVPNKWSILEPPSHTIPHRQNLLNTKDEVLIITPGLGFDKSYGRIGRGKGYYDKFFRSLDQSNVPYTSIAVCFGCQYFDQEDVIPMGEHDVRMKQIIKA